jgi:hypothetical protein
MNRTINREDAKPGDRVTVKIGRSTIVGTVVQARTPGNLSMEVKDWKSPSGYEYSVVFFPHDDITVELEEESFTDHFDAAEVGTVAFYNANGRLSSMGYVKREDGVYPFPANGPIPPIEPNINSAILASRFLWLVPES